MKYEVDQNGYLILTALPLSGNSVWIYFQQKSFLIVKTPRLEDCLGICVVQTISFGLRPNH